MKLIVILMIMMSYDLSAQISSSYLAKYGNIAMTECNKYNLSWEYVLEMGACLSDNGKNAFGKINNHFQIECYSSNCHIGHCTNFQGKTHKKFYIIFNNPIDSYKAYCKLNRYKLPKHATKTRFTCN